MHFEEARGELKRLRDESTRDPQLVLELWTEVIEPQSSRLGDEVSVTYI